MRETVIETKVCEFAESQGWLVRKITYPGRRGAPDRHFYRGGRLIICEFKRPGGAPDPHQAKEHKRLRDAGFFVHVIDDIAEGCRLFV